MAGFLTYFTVFVAIIRLFCSLSFFLIEKLAFMGLLLFQLMGNGVSICFLYPVFILKKLICYYLRQWEIMLL